MSVLNLSDIAVIAAISSTVLSALTLASILKIRKSKTVYNEKTSRIELDVFRKSFEEKIHHLNQRMQSNPDRWKDVNHLVVDGNSGGSNSYVLDSVGGAGVSRPNPYRFFNELGIDFDSLEVVEGQVFVLTPFHGMYEQTYDTIKKACAMNGLVAIRGDEAFKVGNILKHIIEQIIVSPYIVANINGRNPNVHYELGIANSLGKNVLIVSESLEDVAFDLKSERILTYTDQKDLSNKVYIYYTKLLRSGG